MNKNLDTLAQIFQYLETTVNVNTHQIVVLDGHLNFATLNNAVCRAVQEFPLLLSGITKNGRLQPDYWKPTDIPVFQQYFSGEISFSNTEFRRMLMLFDRQNPLLWRCKPVLQFLYIVGNDGQSALMFNTHHAVADAKSDSILLERLMAIYVEEDGSSDSLIRGITHDLIDCDALILEQTRGQRYEYWRSAIGIMFRDIFFRCRGFVAQRQGNTPLDQDFFYNRLSREEDTRIRYIATQTKMTINTVFTAALYRALETNAPGADQPIKIMCPVSLRRYVKQDNKKSFQNFMVPCSLEFPAHIEGDVPLLKIISDKFSTLLTGSVFSHAQRLTTLRIIISLKIVSPWMPALVNFFQGTNACYSNPGRITEDYSRFGYNKVLEYVGFGCLTQPYDFILYTPEVKGQLELNAVYDTRCFSNIEVQLIQPIKDALIQMATELSS